MYEITVVLKSSVRAANYNFLIRKRYQKAYVFAFIKKNKYSFTFLTGSMTRSRIRTMLTVSVTKNKKPAANSSSRPSYRYLVYKQSRINISGRRCSKKPHKLS